MTQAMNRRAQSRRTARLFAAVTLLGCMTLAPVFAAEQSMRADAEKDPLLKAMLIELDRSMAQLQLPGFQKPFFIQYRLEDVDDFQTKAEFGASEGSLRSHQRVVRVTVRVGDYKTDSSGGRGDGSLQLSSLADDPIALRSALWSATDQAYKAALAAYAQKQAELKQVQTPPQADDFSKETPLISLGATSSLKLDDAMWAERMAKASGLYHSDATVNGSEHETEYSTTEFRARVTNTWLVNSEGAIVRKTASEYHEAVAVGTQAADGMHLDRSYASAGSSLADLDDEATFSKHAVNLLASLTDLRNAPLVDEEYHGPVLLSADAGADTMRLLLANSVVATRPKLGTDARTNGAFASSFHARVLPDFLSVTDDPSLSGFGGKSLIGTYGVDDEGVAARAVNLVKNGRLDDYLIGREPVRDFSHSNGHGRAGVTGSPRPTIGVLKVASDEGLSTDDLHRKLLDMGKNRGLKSVYFVETMGGEAPRLLYRITPEGKRELVRGAQLDDLDQRALRSSVEATGKDLFVANYFGDIPQTVIAPALLFSDLTLKRANEKNDKLPFYPPPD